MPQTVGEARDFVLSILSKLPEAVKRIWNEEAMPLWKRMWDWFLGFWNRTIGPIIEPWRQKFMDLLNREVDKRKPDLQKEFQEESKEMQNDLWQRFKDLLK